MAGRTRNLFCLDLSQLRRITPAPTATNGVGRRTFLAGTAAAAFATTGAGKAMAKGFAGGSLRIKRKTGRDGRLRAISVFVDSRYAWTLDVSLYDGEPILSVDETASNLTVRLENALLPGTRFAVNLCATIHQGLMARQARFEFTSTGVEPCDFAFEAPFDAWVLGSAEAETVLPQGLFGSSQTLNDQISIRGAEGRLRYGVDGSFAVAGVAEVIEGQRKLGVRNWTLGPERPVTEWMPGVAAQSRLAGEKAGAWTGSLGMEAQGWRTEGSLRSFNRLEACLPALGAALVSLEASKPGDLAVSDSNGLRLRLEQARLATLVQPGHRTEIFTANLHSEGAWLGMKGASFEVGPLAEDAEVLFACIDGPEGREQYADVQAGIRNATFEIDGAVTRTHVKHVEPVTLVAWDETQGGTRPPTTQVRPGTVQRPPTTVTAPPISAQRPGIAGRLDITAVLKFRLAPFRLDVVRREDMLAISFEFVNLAFTSGGGAPTLVRADASKPAYVAVIFPPQALAEAHFREGPDGGPQLSALSGPAKRPIASRLAGESKLVFWIPTSITGIHFSIKGDDGKGRNGLLEWVKWKPSITATAVQAYGSPKIRIDSAFINPIDSVTIKNRAAVTAPTRIIPPPSEPEDAGMLDSLRNLAASRGPSSQGGDLRTSGALLNPGLGAQIKPSATSQLGRLAVGIDPTLVFKFIPKKRIEPNALHTQIEMPVRVILSPHENAGWLHTAALPENPPSGKFALWHTRLGHRLDVAAGQEPTIYSYSDDGRSYYRVSPTVTEGPFFLAQRGGPTVRVIDSTDYDENPSAPTFQEVIRPVSTGPIQSLYPMRHNNRKNLVDAMCYRGERTDETPAFEVENLMLTPLGGYLKGEWNWKQPSQWPHGDNQPQTIAWRHVSTLGRDQYMKIVERGYLFPTGHKAVMITISERKFNTTTEGKVVAYVRVRRYVAVRDPLIELTGSEVNALGFSSLTLLTLETPVLDPTLPSFAGNIQTDNTLLWLYSGKQPVMFKVRGVDQDGKQANWTMPMLFVFSDTNAADNAPAKFDQLIGLYNNENNKLSNGQRRANMFGQNVAFAPGGGKTPSGQDANGNTSYPVNNMLISAVVSNRTTNYKRDEARWTPVLHTANVSAPAVQMMQGKPPSMGALYMPDEVFDMEALQASTEAMLYADEDGFDVKIPEVFKQNGFGSGNKSQMFLELLEKVGPKFGDTSKTGGIANPNMLIQGLSKGKGPIGGDLADILNGNVDPKKLLDTGAKLLGAVNIFDILPNPIKIDPGGTDAPYIELLLLYDDGKNKPPTGATVAVKWKPPLKNWGFSGEPPLFYVNNFKSNPAGTPFGGATGELLLEGSITTQFKGSEKPKMLFKGSMKNFRVDLISPASFLILDFKLIEFIAEVGKPFDVNVDMTKMTFTGPLTFVQKLQDLINGDDGMSVSADPNSNLPVKRSALSTADPGIEVFLDVDETGIQAGLTITVPTISVGMLAIRNITVGVKLILPFFGDPLTARFNFCERNNTFQLSYMGVTGGGFVAMEINIDGEMVFEAAFEVGGSLSFDIGVASGGVSIMAGIYFRLENKECMLEAYIRINGNLSVLGLIRINLEFYLSLTYYSDGNRLVGTASVTIEIEILFFSVSVTATVQRTLAGESSGGSFLYASNELPMADKTVKFTEAVTQAQWVEFCAAYA